MTHIMKNYGLKLKKIMPVYFIIFFITELGTCLLRWLIEIQFNYYELNELIWICVVPTSLSFIPLFIWLRPKLDILKIKYKPASRRITRSFYYLFPGIIFCLISMLVQLYFSDNVGKHVELQSINEFNKSEKAKYYFFDTINFNLEEKSNYSYKEKDERSNADVTMVTCFAIPIDYNNYKNDNIPKYWMVLNYYDHVFSTSEAVVQSKFDSFRFETLQKLREIPISSFRNLIRENNNEDRDIAINTIRTIYPNADYNNIVVFRPSFNVVQRIGIWIILAASLFGTLLYMFSLIWPPYTDEKHIRIAKGEKHEREMWVKFRRPFIPSKYNLDLPLLLDINIASFLAILILNSFHISTHELIEWGAIDRAQILNGQWWRILTSIFLNNCLILTLCNFVVLLLASLLLKNRFKIFRAITIYLISGMCAGLVSLVLSPDPTTISASGAILGLVSAGFMTIIMDNSSWKGKQILFYILLFVGYFILLCLIFRLDIAANCGGILSGFLSGFLITMQNKSKDSNYLF